MTDLLFVPVTILYLLVVGSLFVYGINFFHLTRVAWKKGKSTLRARNEEPALSDPAPYVTVQLPIYNERYVASRLIHAAARLDYPHDRFEIQVLDDSTDETVQVSAEAVFRCASEGVNIQHLHRTNRQGFKAGALAEGLRTARGEFIAIFDADFLPPRDFLKRTLPHFDRSDVAFVQARWGHLNANYSLLTYLQSLSIDAHFAIEQLARSQAGYWFNFNGTAGIWRHSAIEDAGGWRADTLTEDLDLSYRAFFKNWQARYLHDLEVPSELPVNFSAYRRQQHRWARGSFECAFRYLPRLWEARLPLSHKVAASLHLTGYFVHLLLFCLALLYPFVLILSQRYPQLVSLFGIALLFNLTALAPTILFAAAQQRLGRRWPSRLPAILFMSVLGVGMMLNTGRAALQAALKRKASFERTPKYGIERKQQDWRGKRYQIRLDPIVFLEAGFAFYNLAMALYALRLGNYAITFYAALFSLGLFFTSGFTLMQFVSMQTHQTRQVISHETQHPRPND